MADASRLAASGDRPTDRGVSRKLVVYLAGPIHGCTDAEATDWRAMLQAFTDTGVAFLDPMARDYRGQEDAPGMAAQIVAEDLAEISRAHVVLVNAARASWGTAMEVVYAAQRRKTVLVVIPDGQLDGQRVSPWLAHHASHVVRSWDAAMAQLEAWSRARPRCRPTVTEAEWLEARRRIEEDGEYRADVARSLGVSRQTLHRRERQDGGWLSREEIVNRLATRRVAAHLRGVA